MPFFITVLVLNFFLKVHDILLQFWSNYIILFQAKQLKSTRALLQSYKGKNVPQNSLRLEMRKSHDEEG